MTLDWDGKIRMDCSSPYAMASLVAAGGTGTDVATGNDADADRHGIVTPDAGLMNPNHYLAVAIDYLYRNRPAGRRTAAVGKTLVSLVDHRPGGGGLGRELLEVPVGFKWFVPGLVDGSVGFGGEESRRRVASCAGRHACGPPTRTASCWPCWPRRSPPSPASRRRELYARLSDRSAIRRTPGSTRRPPASRRRRWRKLSPDAGHRHRAGRRADHRQADRGARQRRGDRRAQGGHREGLVRGPAVRHRGRLQDLRRVLQGRRAPRAGPGRGPRGCVRGAWASAPNTSRSRSRSAAGSLVSPL